jgi:hypothetical protein
MLLAAFPAPAFAAEPRVVPRDEADIPELPEGTESIQMDADGNAALTGKDADGTVWTSWLSAQEIREQRHRRFLSGWLPQRLYLNDEFFFIPYLRESVLTIPSKDGHITGLGAASGSDSFCYVLTTDANSWVLTRSLGDDRPRSVADASDITGELWFHDPLSVSPDRRWVIVAATAGGTRGRPAVARAAEHAPGGIYLIDCVTRQKLKLLLPAARLEACAWSPSGRHAVVCARAAEKHVQMVVVDPAQADARVLAEGKYYAFWRADSRRVDLVRDIPAGREVLTYEVSTGEAHAEAQGSALLGTTRPVATAWAQDGAVGAWFEPEAAPPALHLAFPSGPGATLVAPHGVSRLLGWSFAGGLLAYLSQDNRVHVCVGNGDRLSFAGALAVLEDMRKPSGMKAEHQVREEDGMETTLSPLEVRADQQATFCWVLQQEGPTLLYADRDDRGDQAIWAVLFQQRAWRDFGVDFRRNIRTQRILEGCVSNLGQFGLALYRYAQQHDGRLPEHATGMGLADELKVYLDYAEAPSIYSSPYANGEIRVSVLLPGEKWLGEGGIGTDGEAARHTAIAELRGDDGYLFRYYADHHVETIGPSRR